jgi:hypothetical protein
VGRERELALLAAVGGNAVDLPRFVDEIVAKWEINPNGAQVDVRELHRQEAHDWRTT